MEINPQIKVILEAHNVDYKDGLCYLLSVYHDCRPSYVPTLLVSKINTTNILGVSNKALCWNTPLYLEVGTKIEEKWDWVNTMMDMFAAKNPARKGPKSAVHSRMKAFFAANPDVRKDDVLGAVGMYLNQIDPFYVTSTHYFIHKGTGPTKVSLLEEWIDKYRAYELTQVKTDDGIEDVTSKMQ